MEWKLRQRRSVQLTCRILAPTAPSDAYARRRHAAGTAAALPRHGMHEPAARRNDMEVTEHVGSMGPASE